MALAHVILDPDRRLIRRGVEEIPLTSQEAALLAYLLVRPGEVISRDRLLVDVWGYKPGLATRAVDNTVARLRTKIELDPREPSILKTVHGLGYRLDLPASASMSGEPALTLPLPSNTNLAPTSDRFVGRVTERAALEAALDSPGLVTLFGPGGVGKTRLAREVGLASVDRWPGGVWFVDLSSISAPGAVPAVVARVLGISGQLGDELARSQVGYALANRGHALLILDNVEQILPAINPLLARWASPELRILLSSRVCSGLPEERCVPVGPLDPASAARLFGSRARRARKGFQIGPENAAAVERLLQRLDYLPLAIELAASWADVLSPDRLLARLERYAALPSRSHREGRHASLDAALDWSWEMLSPELQRTFAATAVFRGGFDLEAAEAVLGPEALDLLETLRARSLLQFDGGGDRGPRFSLLQTASDFATRKLGEDPEAEARYAAHETWYLGLAERSEGRLDDELDNLLILARRARGLRPEASARGALLADRVLRVRGPMSQRLNSLEEAARQLHGGPLADELRLAIADTLRLLGRVDEASATLAGVEAPGPAADLVRAQLAQSTGDLEGAVRAAEASVAVARAAGEGALEASALRVLSVLHQERGQLAQAELCALAALTRYREQGDRAGEAFAMGTLGNAALALGRHGEARARYTEALALHVATGHRWGEATVLGNLATALFEAGRHGPAEAAYTAAIAAHRAVGNRRFEAMALSNAGVLAWVRGESELADRRLGAAAALHREVGNPRSLAYVLLNLAIIRQAEGSHLLARGLLDEVDTLSAGLGDALLATSAGLWSAVVWASLGDKEAAIAKLGALPETPASMAAERALVEDALTHPDEAWRARCESLLLAGGSPGSVVQRQALVAALRRL